MSGAPTLPGDMVEVRAPASHSFIEVFRGAARRVTRISGMSNDGTDDFSLAVDEAAVLLLESEPTAVTMSISVVPPQGLLVVLIALSSRAPWPPPLLESDIRWRTIGAMCEDMWLVEGVEAGIGLFQSMR